MSPTSSSLFASARADYLAGNHPAARRALEGQAELDLEAAPLLSLCWVRQILADRPAGSVVDAPTLFAALADPFDHPRLEGDRHFVLGWLHWLQSEPLRAESELGSAVPLLVRVHADTAGEAAYWLARVHLALHRDEALADYERTLRTLSASPRQTCWFVDLLWRAGQHDRAESVWNTVRGNRRVMSCEEAPLLEARPLLRRGETAAAERILTEANPRGGVVQMERLLLLAWALATLNRSSQAMAVLRQTEAGPYPAAVLQRWQQIIASRSTNVVEPVWPEASGALTHLVAGQKAWSEGRRDEALAALRKVDSVVLRPFARYARAALGDDDFAALLNAQPGWFLAMRCRARIALDRFRRSEISPTELLDALQQAESSGYRPQGAEHFRRLALALKQRNPHPEDLRRLVDSPVAEGEAAARNSLRAALESTRVLPAAKAIDLLLEWTARGRDTSDEVLRAWMGRQLLRQGSMPVPPHAGALTAARELLQHHPALLLSDEWSQAEEPAALPATLTDGPSLLRLWRAAVGLRNGSEDRRRLREEIVALRSESRFRGLAQGLLVCEAASRSDVTTALTLLDEADAWRGFPSGPPGFVAEALTALSGLGSTHARWRPTLTRWLSFWQTETLPPALRTLAAQAGPVRLSALDAEIPNSAPQTPWLLHQAAQALLREDAREALAWVRRAMSLDLGLNGAGNNAGIVFAALSQLERLVRAQRLAEVIRLDPKQEAVSPRVLVNFVEELDSPEAGRTVIAAAANGDYPAARKALAALVDAPNITPRLAHHLAIAWHRAALFAEENGLPEAEPLRLRAWKCWLRFLAAIDPPAGQDHPLLGNLLGLHRRRITQRLARNDVESARRDWDFVRTLPALARGFDGRLADTLQTMAERFAEELATDYLTATRDAMRYGTIPEGYRADYEKGLSGLARLLALDGENTRLLCAVVETCNEWFHDCYRNDDGPALLEGVERYTPYALKLALLVDRNEGDLTARAALADFYKFRGFVASQRDRKAALFREALKFDPRNANARELLGQVEES